MSKLVELARSAIVQKASPNSIAQPRAEDKDFFRAILCDPRIARYAGADSEDRKAKVLHQLADSSVKRAMAITKDGTITVGVRVDGVIWTQDLRIPEVKFDPFLILERFEKATLQ